MNTKNFIMILVLVVIVFAILLTFTRAGSANPSITQVDGIILDGELVTLNGSNFGFKEGYTEFLGGKTGHIETTAPGKDVDFGNWRIADGNGTDSPAFIVTEGARSGNHAWSIDSNYNGSVRYDYGEGVPEHTDIFISWWVKFDAPQDPVGQWKMFRLSHHNDIQDSGTELVMFNWFAGSGDQLIVRPDRCPQGKNAVSYYGGNYPSTPGAWVRVDQYVRTSTQGRKDGYSETTLLGDVISLSNWGNSSDAEPQYPSIYTYNSDMRYRWFIWQNYRGNGLDQLTVMLDDIYIQVGSVARVELGNKPVFEEANVREIQRVKSWDQFKIEIELNQGAFQIGDTAWLFVVDEFGHHGEGFEVKISGSDEVDDGCSG
jgi:hypothetical protein